MKKEDKIRFFSTDKHRELYPEDFQSLDFTQEKQTNKRKLVTPDSKTDLKKAKLDSRH